MNATTGFDAVSLANPWDFVLLIEGVMVFAGSIVKRFGTAPRAAFPFTFTSTVGGFGSASAEEETRGEVWLPRWRGFATYRSIAAMIRTARVDVETTSNPHQPSARAAETAVEAAEATISHGLTNGLDGFDRIVVAQRNGLAFAATRVGYVGAVDNPITTAAASLAREASFWMRRVRGREGSPGSLAAVRAYDDAVFAFTQQRRDEIGLQEWLAVLGRLDAAVGMAPIENVAPFQFRDADTARRVAAALDDGSDEHALAAGWSSVGSATRDWALRFNQAPVARKDGRLVYTASHEHQGTLLRVLARACVRRAREAHELGSRVPIEGRQASGISTGTLARWLNGEHGPASLARIERLLAGYVLLSPSAAVDVDTNQAPDEQAASALPTAWCAIKLLFDGLPATRGRRAAALPLDRDVPALLQARRTHEALQRTYRSATIARSADTILADRPLRDIREAALLDADRACAALLLPLDDRTRYAVRNRALQPDRT